MLCYRQHGVSSPACGTQGVIRLGPDCPAPVTKARETLRKTIQRPAHTGRAKANPAGKQTENGTGGGGTQVPGLPEALSRFTLV